MPEIALLSINNEESDVAFNLPISSALIVKTSMGIVFIYDFSSESWKWTAGTQDTELKDDSSPISNSAIAKVIRNMMRFKCLLSLTGSYQNDDLTILISKFGAFQGAQLYYYHQLEGSKSVTSPLNIVEFRIKINSMKSPIGKLEIDSTAIPKGSSVTPKKQCTIMYGDTEIDWSYQWKDIHGFILRQKVD